MDDVQNYHMSLLRICSSRTIGEVRTEKCPLRSILKETVSLDQSQATLAIGQLLRERKINEDNNLYSHIHYNTGMEILNI